MLKYVVPNKYTLQTHTLSQIPLNFKPWHHKVFSAEICNLEHTLLPPLNFPEDPANFLPSDITGAANAGSSKADAVFRVRGFLLFCLEELVMAHFCWRHPHFNLQKLTGQPCTVSHVTKHMSNFLCKLSLRVHAHTHSHTHTCSLSCSPSPNLLWFEHLLQA